MNDEGFYTSFGRRSTQWKTGDKLNGTQRLEDLINEVESCVANPNYNYWWSNLI